MAGEATIVTRHMSLAHIAIARLRLAGFVEGVSFLILLGVAMPLKYFANLPMAVKIAGWTHGILFILFCLALWKAKRSAGWPYGETGLLLLAALLPFGPFVVDKRLKRQLSI